MAVTAGASMSQAATATPALASARVMARPWISPQPPTTTATLPASPACASSSPMFPPCYCVDRLDDLPRRRRRQAMIGAGHLAEPPTRLQDSDHYLAGGGNPVTQLLNIPPATFAPGAGLYRN